MNAFQKDGQDPSWQTSSPPSSLAHLFFLSAPFKKEVEEEGVSTFTPDSSVTFARHGGTPGH
ncbi:hypothetical protein EYF80_053272 [Liparis tanakae]|uniref:Uncharacterized protein n=1 Tax=Liparis tanakae TaxID=230148 RepID=A0A4Z2F6S1_9TELE|nr:hypothetical protein EYF80_053272 [Liparis tanakae]